MAPPDARGGEVIKGTLDLLILRTLQLGSMHGWGITELIEQRSADLLSVNRGPSTRRCTASFGSASYAPSGARTRTTGARATTSSPPRGASNSPTNAPSGSACRAASISCSVRRRAHEALRRPLGAHPRVRRARRPRARHGRGAPLSPFHGDRTQHRARPAARRGTTPRPATVRRRRAPQRGCARRAVEPVARERVAGRALRRPHSEEKP